MLVGIYNLKTPYGKERPSQIRYETILAHNHIPFVRIDPSRPDFWTTVRTLDLLVFHWSQWDIHRQPAHDLLPVIDKELQIKCFPNWNTCWHYDDKVKQYCLLKAREFPIVESFVFWDKHAAINWLEGAELPTIFKLRCGAASSNVIKVSSREHGRRLINRMFGRGICPDYFFDSNNVRVRQFNLGFELRRIAGRAWRLIKGLDTRLHWRIEKNYVLFQKFLPDNVFDTRVTVIGERAFGFRRFVRANDFRASGSGSIDYDIHAIDMRCVRIALDISREMGYQSMAYDFLINEDNAPQFCEISYTYDSDAIYRCPGYWDSKLTFHEGNYWPEYLQLQDVLECAELKQPDL